MARTYPFLISGVLIIVGLVTMSRLDGRLNLYVTRDPDKTSRADLTGDLYHLQPEKLRNVITYWVDLTQATALIIGPVLGILILVNLSQVWVATAYAVSVVAGIALILWLALAADEGSYGVRTGRLRFTWVTAIGLGIDIVAGLVAYFAGGPVHHT
jgi:hypothetical protein